MLWTPRDFHTIMRTCLSPLQFWQWMFKTKLQQPSHSGRRISVQMTYEMLIQEGKYADVNKVSCPIS